MSGETVECGARKLDDKGVNGNGNLFAAHQGIESAENAEAPNCSGEAPIVQGYLKKGSANSGSARNWRKRWCVLTDSRFTLSKGSGATHPRTVIDLGGGSVSQEEGDNGQKLILNVSTARGRTLELCAATVSDASAWYDALFAACSLPEPAEDESSSKKHTASKSQAEGQGSDDEKDPTPASVASGGLPVLLVLDITAGPCQGSRFEIASDGVKILRKPTGIAATHHKNLRQLQLPDADISRQHAEITCKDNLFSIRDLGSLNGTHVNDKRLSEEKKQSDWQTLAGGDKLLVGKSEMVVFFRVKVPDAPPSLEEQERRRRRAERRDKREQRRRERIGQRAGGASGSKRAREEPARSDAVDQPRNASGPRASAVSSSKIAATAELFLHDVLGGGGGGGGGRGAGGGSVSSGGASGLRPNTAALSSIVGGVLDHNERLREEEEHAAKKRMHDMPPNMHRPPPFPPPPPPGTYAPMQSNVFRPPPFPPPPAPHYQARPPPIPDYAAPPQNPSLVPASVQQWAPVPPASYAYASDQHPAWHAAPHWTPPPPAHQPPPPGTEAPPSTDVPAPGEGNWTQMTQMQLPTRFGGK